MKLEKFPPAYKTELDKRTQQEISEESKLSYRQKDSLESSVGTKPNGSNWVLGCGVLGFVIGFFICVSYHDEMDFWDIVGPWILLTIGGLIVGGILTPIVHFKYYKTVQKLNSQIFREESRYKTTRETILKDAEKEYNQYVVEFEDTAQGMSVQFAESQLAIDAIEWMTNGFIKTIDAADRHSYIESVNIPFDFKVYENKITCNLGTFDFEIKRCRNLNSPLEQTALARAIASSIQLNVTMKYPKDISGTDVVTNIGYSYGADYVSTTIIYTAQNGNFITVRDWN